MLRSDEEIDDCVRESVLPESEHQTSIDYEEIPSVSEMYGCFNPGENITKTCHYDIGQDIGLVLAIPGHIMAWQFIAGLMCQRMQSATLEELCKERGQAPYNKKSLKVNVTCTDNIRSYKNDQGHEKK
ncbi:hypothetical protein KUTeg_021939 [Tegillarca granosa]|uniref:Uncharacterized protein n=1 Tax=Tegillarca granosa TaxID=220873 RepID=A0ABQ9EAC2_TEGGR|nr:hypothetical protein KUTeg_021939 [Tegillarca granosa]